MDKKVKEDFCLIRSSLQIIHRGRHDTVGLLKTQGALAAQHGVELEGTVQLRQLSCCGRLGWPVEGCQALAKPDLEPGFP